jgi:hypothetical protein
LCGEDRGGGVIYPSSSPSLEDLDPRGILSLSPSPFFLIEGMFRLPPGLILGRVDVPLFAAATLKPLHKATSVMKR